MLDYIEKFDLPETERSKYLNELQSLHYLRVGLKFLYKNVKKIENEVAKQIPPNIRYFSFGNDPNMPRIPHETKALIACSFHWYSVSICNYVWMVGWLQHKNNPNTPTAKDYRNSVLPKEVIAWRDKVAAHFARADNDKRDNPAERMASVFYPSGFYDDAFYASPMKLMVTKAGQSSTSESMHQWSLTKLHEQLRPRYWPTP